jgi:hypothetical protein
MSEKPRFRSVYEVGWGSCLCRLHRIKLVVTEREGQ